MHLFHRTTTRRAMLAAVAPAAVAACAVLPCSASAGTIVLGGGTLDYHDTSGRRQNVSVAVQGTTVRIRDNADPVALAGTGNPCVVVSTSEASCPLDRVGSIRGFLAGGNDSWISSVAFPTTVEGGDGNDEFFGGLSASSSRVDFRGGPGSDSASYVASGAGVTVTKDEQANDGRAGRDADLIRGDVERLIGSTLNDSLNGSSDTAQTEVFDGGLGDDVLSGNAGHNFYAMGRTADGVDTINGGPGRDHVDYSQRTRPIIATLNIDDRNDGEAGEGDSLRNVEGITGGQAGDTLKAPFGSRAAYDLNGGGGSDTLEGGEGRDTFFPGAGGDTVKAFGEADLIFADADNAADVLDCGGGIDTAHIDTSDSAHGCETRKVGTLRLTPKAARVDAAGTARIALAWTHPRSWRDLRQVVLRLTDDGMPVGHVAISPRSGRMTEGGAVRLVRDASAMTREGRSARARLALRLIPSAAGRTLRLEVEATDTDGRRQLERSAGTLRVGR
jgi:Ca2+-binding RTX toxin-like protein